MSSPEPAPRRAATQPRCPYCLDDLAHDDEAVRCARCRTPHHAACFQEHGGCCSFGCVGRLEVPAGASIFLRQSIKGLLPSGSSALGPFALEWRRLDHVPERRPPSRCPPAHARLNLEGRELREGQALRGRAAVYVPERVTYRTIDLVLTQGLRRPEEVARVTLVDARRGLQGGELALGSHPFALDLRAPETTGPVDAFALELVLSRGMFQGDIGSQRWPVFLLEAPHRDEAQHAVILAPAARPAARVPRLAPVANPDGGGPGGQSIDVFAEPAAPDGWTLVQADGLQVAARPARPREGAAFALQAGPIEDGAELALRIDGPPRPLRALHASVRGELCRPGGAEVPSPSFPGRSEVRLLGAGGLDPTGPGGRALEAVLRIPVERLAALAQARQDGAHNAALRIGIALEAELPDGRRERGPSRTVTISSLPLPPSPGAAPAQPASPPSDEAQRTMAGPPT